MQTRRRTPCDCFSLPVSRDCIPFCIADCWLMIVGELRTETTKYDASNPVATAFHKCATLKVPSNTVTRLFFLSCDLFVKRKCRTGRNRGEIVSNLRAEDKEPNDFGVEFSFANRATRKSSNRANTRLSNRIRGSGAVLVRSRQGRKRWR